MALKVVGAGVGRTGTASLKKGLEQLLGGPCYHMTEVFEHPEHVPSWHAAARGESVGWDSLFAGYAAAVDWPASAFWPRLSAHFPEAIVLFSRRDPEAWWESASATIFRGIPSRKGSDSDEWYEMVMTMLNNTFTSQIDNREACIAAYNRHEEFVRQTAPQDRLVVWEAGDGWGPLCQAMNLPVPEIEFPKVNTREEFLARHEAGNKPPAVATATP